MQATQPINSKKRAIVLSPDEGAIARSLLSPYFPMTDEELYTHNARDYAELAEVWARRSRHYANSIDLPSAMLITIAINLLLTLILYSYVRH